MWVLQSESAVPHMGKEMEECHARFSFREVLFQLVIIT